MRIRALLSIPALAATVLGIGAGGASGATLFTSTAHTTRVAVGATATLLASSALDVTSPSGSVAIHCTTADLIATVGENSDTRVDLRLTSGFLANCTNAVTPTFATPWTVTITGSHTVIGTTSSWTAQLHNLAFDIAGFPGVFTGTLGPGVTASQPTAAGSPISLNFHNAQTITNATLGVNSTLDGNLVFFGGGAGWSLAD